MQVLKRFGLFWVDFVVGDDWTVAATVVVALAVTWLLSTSTFPAWTVVPVMVWVALGVSIARARRAAARRTDAADPPG